MDFASGGNASGGEASFNPREGEKQYHRISDEHMEELEEFFEDCPQPDENQLRQLSEDMGLPPSEISIWFQNKRTQVEADQKVRVENDALRAENEKIQSENIMLRETLMKQACPNCECSTSEEDLQKVLIENAKLKEEYERIANILASLHGKPGK